MVYYFTTIVIAVLIFIIIIFSVRLHHNIISNNTIFESILFHLSRMFHERLTHKIMLDIINQANIKYMIDAGGWLGDTCTQLAENNSDIKIYTIEPSLENCNFIKNYIEKHNIKNIKILQKCLSANDTHKCKTESHAIFSNKTYKKSDRGIDAITIDDIYKKHYDLGLIHLDVEGNEFECLQGATESFKKGTIIFIVEILGQNKDKHNIINLFRKNNYIIYVIPERVGASRKGRNFIFFPKNYTNVNTKEFVKKYGLKYFRSF